MHQAFYSWASSCRRASCGRVFNQENRGSITAVSKLHQLLPGGNRSLQRKNNGWPSKKVARKGWESPDSAGFQQHSVRELTTTTLIPPSIEIEDTTQRKLQLADCLSTYKVSSLLDGPPQGYMAQDRPCTHKRALEKSEIRMRIAWHAEKVHFWPLDGIFREKNCSFDGPDRQTLSKRLKQRDFVT